MNELDRIKSLIRELNEANRAYYSDGKEIMSNFDYDAKYDELVALEEKTGIIMSNSPTVNVGSSLADYLPKVEHESKMLSLAKTKEVSKLAEFLAEGRRESGTEGLLSFKLDGLTVVLTYRDGSLDSAVTRGNGEVGELITSNAKLFKNLPLKIKEKGEVVLRGEAVIKYSDFEKVNDKLGADEQYKNPRNLCSGTVRALDSVVLKDRAVHFYAFSLVSSDRDFSKKSEMLDFLKEQGFDVVDYVFVNEENISKEVENFKKKVVKSDVGSDGLVLTYDDVEFSKSLGSTAKFPRDAMAFKWQDETASTILREIIFSPSRTGLINPIAVFEPVELEGTTVTRASLHNLSIMEGLELGIGDEIEVYKANMIIPQLADNHTRSATVKPVETCPACGDTTIIQDENGVRVLICPNDYCPAKKGKSFTHFVSRDCMNIEGMSEKTLLKFIDEGFLESFVDVYRLDRFKDRITKLEGFGEKSYENIIASVEKSKQVKLPFFINALGIKNIGLSNAKSLCEAFDNNLDKLMSASYDDLIAINGIGPNMANDLLEYFSKEENQDLIAGLRSFVCFEKEEKTDTLAGLNFVITGSLEKYENRKAMTAIIEQNGGKVVSGVSAKTSYLINNDTTSTSSKNTKAKKLGIPIISEDEFEKMLIQ